MPALDSCRCVRQILGRKLRIPVHHAARFPATQILELVATGARLTMPGRPGVTQIMKPKVRNPRSAYAVCQ